MLMMIGIWLVYFLIFSKTLVNFIIRQLSKYNYFLKKKNMKKKMNEKQKMCELNKCGRINNNFFSFREYILFDQDILSQIEIMPIILFSIILKMIAKTMM